MATRHTLQDAYRGGRVNPEEPVDDKPKRLRYPCFAEGCPMPGSITMDGHREPTCAWHFGVLPNDIPKVTRVLKDWDCVSFEIREARRVLSGELAADAKALTEAFTKAWERLQPLSAGWEHQLRPGTIHTSKGVDTGLVQNYRDWMLHLERFLGARVVEVLSTNQRRAA